MLNMLSFTWLRFLLLFMYCCRTQYDDCLDLIKDCDAKPNTDIDNTFAFFSCQNRLNQTNGGCIIVPDGKYQLLNVILNTSNTIVYINSSVTLIPYNGTCHSDHIFQLGSSTTFVNNISIIGISSTKYFLIDLAMNKTIDPSCNVTGISVMGVDRFVISNVNIQIASNLFQERPAISLSHRNINDTIYHGMNGRVTNITSSDYIYGYGTIQIQSGENIFFENLDGVTLRLETGAGDQDGYVNNITGRNVICRNGHAALMAEPHTQKNGYFNVYNLTSYSCYIGAQLNGGYSQNGKPPGYFKNGTVNGVISYWGNNAQIDKNDTGPSCGPCGSLNSVLNYPVVVSGLQSIDFPAPSNRNSCPHWSKTPVPPICPFDNSSAWFNMT